MSQRQNEFHNVFTLTSMTKQKKFKTMITVQNKIYITGTWKSATV